jgi:two-component system LytT family sensor kinase
MTVARKPRRWPLALAVFGGWAAIGVVSASLTYNTWQAEQIEAGLGRAILIIGPYWLFWAFATPVIGWVVTRVPLEHGRLGPGIAAQVLTCVVIVTVHVTLYMAANYWLFPWPAGERVPSLSLLTSSYLRSRWQYELMIYLAVLGGSLALRYYRSAQERTVCATQLEAQLAQAQLQALRMQLHPHFLFNTLQAVSFLVVENPPVAQHMLTQLGDLLRAVLDGDERQEIPLQEEIDFLQRYLAIEQVRFADRLTVTFSVDEAVRHALVPGFVLQPLVENAIRYAIAPSARPGCIDISARAQNGSLRLAVRDSGAGFVEPISEGVGIATTRARIGKMYGGSDRLRLGSAPGGGAEAALDLPLRYADANDV